MKMCWTKWPRGCGISMAARSRTSRERMRSFRRGSRSRWWWRPRDGNRKRVAPASSALPEKLPGLQVLQQVLCRFFRLIGRDDRLLVTQILVADGAVGQFVRVAQGHVNHKSAFAEANVTVFRRSPSPSGPATIRPANHARIAAGIRDGGRPRFDGYVIIHPEVSGGGIRHLRESLGLQGFGDRRFQRVAVCFGVPVAIAFQVLLPRRLWSDDVARNHLPAVIR